jgi:hypothetical protein
MQASELITQIRSELVEPIAGFWTDAELLGWINRAEADFVNRTRILDDRDYTSTIQGVTEYPLPSNCLSIRGVMYNRALATETPDWTRLVPSNLEKTMQQTPNFPNLDVNAQNDPGAYMVWGRTLIVFPTPKRTQSDNIILYYKAKPIPLAYVTDQINLDDSLREAIIAYVLWKALKKGQEDEKAIEQAQIYEVYVKQGLRWTKKQSGDQRYRIDIVSPTPFEGPFDSRFNPLQ